MPEELLIEPTLAEMEEEVLAEGARMDAPAFALGRAARRTGPSLESGNGGRRFRLDLELKTTALESACRQRPFRFKRPGQFWTAKGLGNLCALEEARHNRHWEKLWHSTKP